LLICQSTQARAANHLSHGPHDDGYREGQLNGGRGCLVGEHKQPVSERAHGEGQYDSSYEVTLLCPRDRKASLFRVVPLANRADHPEPEKGPKYRFLDHRSLAAFFFFGFLTLALL
jgi:hypothetical protein